MKNRVEQTVSKITTERDGRVKIIYNSSINVKNG